MISGWSSADPITIEFAVTTVWKGSVYEVAHLETARMGASCGFSFVEDVEYLVYSRDGSEVSLCSRTRQLSKAGADLTELGEGWTPDPTPVRTRLTTPLISGLSVLVLAGFLVLAGYVFYRRKRALR